MKTQSLEAQLRTLPTQNRSSILRLYRKLWGKPVSGNWSDAQLQLAVGYRLQQQLLARMSSKAMEAINAAEATISLLSGNSVHRELIREWRGKIHTVTLLEDGLLYGGRNYGSLTAVAKAITGKRADAEKLFQITVVQVETGARHVR